MTPSVLSLIPPFILFVVATITHNVLHAFIAGIFAVLLIIAHANPILMVQFFLQQVFAYLSDSHVIMSFLFLISIGSIITLLSKIRLSTSHRQRTGPSLVRSARIAEYVGVFFSFLFSVDDYLSILTVGFLMTQLSSHYRIAKERIAYFVHALSGPLVILVPISSWAAEIVSQLYQAGVHEAVTSGAVIDSNPLFLYVASMGYNFYSFLTIFSVLFFIQTQKRMEKETAITDKMVGREASTVFPVFDTALPLCILLCSTFIGLLYTGDYHLFGGTRSLLQALQNSTSTFFVLAVSGFFAFFVGFLYQYMQKRITHIELFSCLFEGFELMRGAITLIFLASIFGVFVRRDLLAGVYLADKLLAQMPLSFMPLMTFVTSLFIAIVTGTAWGTFALMIPIVIQMLMTATQVSTTQVLGAITPDAIPFLLPCLGAIFSGGVCGDHLSLFSETTIMTATATGITPMQHAKSQFFYAVFALVTTILLFSIFAIVPRSYSYSPFIFVTTGILVCAFLMRVGARYSNGFKKKT
jgi:tetracycline resistance efflux pump